VYIGPASSKWSPNLQIFFYWAIHDEAPTFKTHRSVTIKGWLLGMNCWEWFDREEQSWNVNDKKKYVAS
jgi:hypothetical protein